MKVFFHSRVRMGRETYHCDYVVMVIPVYSTWPAAERGEATVLKV